MVLLRCIPGTRRVCTATTGYNGIMLHVALHTMQVPEESARQQQAIMVYQVSEESARQQQAIMGIMLHVALHTRYQKSLHGNNRL